MQTSPSQSPFFNAVMAAPMVRVSTLAFRLLCAHHGSSLVFTEELVAAKLMKCKRRYLPQLDFLLERANNNSNNNNINHGGIEIPEKFSSVLNKLKQALLLARHIDVDSSKFPFFHNGDIADVLLSWIRNYPFLEEAIFSGRVEGLYVGHQQQPQKQSTTTSGGGAATNKKQHQKNSVTEGEEESEQGEIVFTTLAKLLPKIKTADNKFTNNFETDLKNHCRFELVFPKTEAGKPLVGQIGASHAEVAVAGFDLLAPFVSACDTNMGCPKAFSVKNGMGAALMSNKDGAAKILKGLAENFPLLPISYKTRLFENLNDSMDHLRACFEATGNRLHAFTIHSRNRPQRSETAPLYQDAATLVQMIRADEELKNLCLIFNGSLALRPLPDVVTGDGSNNDAEAVAQPERKEIDLLISSSLCGSANILKSVSSYGFNGALLARSSMWKPSVFVNHEPGQPLGHVGATDTLLYEFQNLLIAYAACGDQVRLFKYHMTRAIPEYQNAEGVIGRGADAKKSAAELNQSIFLPIRDGKTFTDFATALKFIPIEIDAVNWMVELVQWRRSLASIVVDETWNPYNPSEDKLISNAATTEDACVGENDIASSTSLPERRERNEE